MEQWSLATMTHHLRQIESIPCDPRLGDPVTPSKIQHAIQKMKTEKAPGKNGIPPEAFKLLTGLGEDVPRGYHH
jgi:hypothetical protein